MNKKIEKLKCLECRKNELPTDNDGSHVLCEDCKDKYFPGWRTAGEALAPEPEHKWSFNYEQKPMIDTLLKQIAQTLELTYMARLPKWLDIGGKLSSSKLNAIIVAVREVLAERDSLKAEVALATSQLLRSQARMQKAKKLLEKACHTSTDIRLSLKYSEEALALLSDDNDGDK